MAQERNNSKQKQWARPKKKSSTAPYVLGAVISAIGVSLLIAVFAGGSDSNTASGTTAPPKNIQGENFPVEVTGPALTPLPEVGADPALGQKAPTIAGVDFRSNLVSVTPGDGKKYMVVFLAHWCPHCNAEIPRLIEWKESGAIPADLNIVGVSTAVAADRPNFPPSDWIEMKHWPWVVMADSAAQDAAAAFGVAGYPFFTLVDTDGTVKLRVSGEVEIDKLTQMVNDAFAS